VFMAARIQQKTILKGDKMYTKGKWEVSTYEGGWDCVRSEQGTIICKLGLNEPGNAERICKCVNSHDELLEACKEAAHLITNHDEGDHRAFIECENGLLKAITKAEN